MSTFSIILPTCDRPHFLTRAVNSVLNQTYKSFELLVIDDSTSPLECRKFEWGNHPQVRLLRSKGAAGPSYARNIGIKKSSGKFISFLDDDDEYDSNFLEATLAVLNDSPDTVGASFCNPRFIDYELDGTPFLNLNSKQPLNPTSCETIESFLSMGIGCGVTIKSECLQSVGNFDDRFTITEDTDLFYRIVSAGYEPVMLNNSSITVHRHLSPRLSCRQLNSRRVQECYILLAKYAVFLEAHTMIRDRLCAHVARLKENCP